MILVYNATYDVMIFGKPFFSNSNITVDYDRSLLGLSNGKNLNPEPVLYGGRVLILFLTFSFIAGSLSALAKLLTDKDKKDAARRASQATNEEHD